MKNRREVESGRCCSKSLIILIAVCSALTIATIIAITVYHAQRWYELGADEDNNLHTDPHHHVGANGSYEIQVQDTSHTVNQSTTELSNKPDNTIKVHIPLVKESTHLNITTPLPEGFDRPTTNCSESKGILATKLPKDNGNAAMSTSHLDEVTSAGNSSLFSKITGVKRNVTTTSPPETGPGHGVVCQSEEFQCRSGTQPRCIPSSHICDGVAHCSHGSDEMNCTCAPHETKCNNSQECIESKLWCDNHNDCGDGSDELNCVLWRCDFDQGCPIAHFQAVSSWSLTSTGNYLHVNNARKEAVFRHGTFKFEHFSCLTMDYQMNMAFSSSLSVQLETISENDLPSFTHVWTIHGNQRKKWRTVSLLLPPLPEFNLVILASKGAVRQSEIAIDNLELKRGKCPDMDCPRKPHTFQCTISKICIDPSNVCDGKYDCGYLYLDFSDELNCDVGIATRMIIDFEETPFMRSRATVVDNRTWEILANSRGEQKVHYFRLQTHPDTPVVGSFLLHPVSSSPLQSSCLSFHYIMHGSGLKLEVFSSILSGHTGLHRISLFKMKGHQGADWQHAAVNINRNNILINFEGSSQSGGALFTDNIQIQPQPCSYDDCSRGQFQCKINLWCISELNVEDGEFDCGEGDTSDESTSS